MKCYCINKDICILCQEYKYYNIYCTRCVSGKVCYICSSGMLESSLIKSCPVCRLETTEDKKWYKIKYNPKIIVPTQPFGSKFRGGKLLSLISQSNELRDFFNKMYQSNVVLFYTMSLFGSTKSSSQYDQLDRYIKFIGVTESKHPIRMKNPQKEQLLEWLDRRGISRSLFVKNSSSQDDKTFKNLIHFLEYSLLQNRHDKTVSKLRKLFSTTIDDLMNRTEKKRVYVGTYGMENWDDNLYNSVPVVDHKNNLDCLFDYWKSKVFKKKDWGMRKYKHYLDQPVPLEYELLNDQLRDSNFNYVR